MHKDFFDPNSEALSPVEQKAKEEKSAKKTENEVLKRDWISVHSVNIEFHSPKGPYTHEKIIVEHCGGVCVLPFIDEKTVLLVRQYRSPVNEIILEVPAGRIDHKESPESSAQRELQEETHYKAGKLISLGTMLPSPGFCTEKVYLYAGKDLKRSPLPGDLGEVLELVALPFKKAHTMVLNGELTDGKTALALLKWAALHPEAL